MQAATTVEKMAVSTRPELCFCVLVWGMLLPVFHSKSLCMQNDIAVAVAYALHAYDLQRVLVIDLDVHQGNGTAEIFEKDDRVTTV